MSRKKILFIILLSTIIIVLLPMIIDWIIIGNEFPSNISNSDWVSFLGGYVGAIIGAVISIISIIITIRFTSIQNKKDRELQVRPYCSIRYVHSDKLSGTNKILAEYPIGCEPQGKNSDRYIGIIYIKNIGIGPAIEFNFEVDEINDGREHYLILMQRNEKVLNNYVNLLQSGEEGAFIIYINFNFDPILETDMEYIEGLGRTVKYTVLEKYKGYDINLKVKYKDLFHNQFMQSITLGVQISASISEKNGGNYVADVYLKEQTSPIKI